MAEQILEKEATCPLCLDLFKEPKKLPCDHVYCKECLRGLALRSLNATISCPECRTSTQVPGNDVNNFPTAFRVNRLIEAFQQMHVRVEVDSPSITEICPIHSTQPLALYCETYKKQLCRDCVLVTKEHASHTCGFFKDVAPKYREKFVREMSLIKTQDLSISYAIGEIAAAETSVANHAQKCQDEVDRTFEEMISVLQDCKQAMKDEMIGYYSSVTGVFDQQKEQLMDIQSKIKSVVTSVDTTLQDNDQSFLLRMESTSERISNLQKQLQTVPLTVAKPQLIATHVVSPDSLRNYMKTNSFLYKLADANMCLIEGSPSFEWQVGQQTSFTLTLRDSKGNTCGGENRVDADLVNLQLGKMIKGNIEPLSQGHMKVILTPERRGRHKLNVTVNGAHIRDSPIKVFVNIPPKLLTQPVEVISGLKHPACLIYSQGKILATEMSQNRIIEINSQLQVQEVQEIIGANELTQDLDLNYYVTNISNHKLHKLNKHGRIVKTIGKFGSKNAEFNFPSGLKIRSSSNELYVCDRSNHRIQVFDLDLNFKRSFGKKGKGKGQFCAPNDIDFDTLGHIYVLEGDNNRIQVLTHNECHMLTIGNKSLAQAPSIDKFNTPVSLVLLVPWL